jgi:RNA polymerase subunit RPABC4/transcription elongation factor Spt4
MWWWICKEGKMFDEERVAVRAKMRAAKYKANNVCRRCGKGITDLAKFCKRCHQLGPGSHNWSGGVHITSCGYKAVKCPTHPQADARGYVLEHRLVMESHIGRTLLQSEVVHHIDGDRLHNDIENLMLFSGTADHLAHHREIAALPDAPKGKE